MMPIELTEQQFNDFIYHRYEHSSYEQLTGDARFAEDVNYAHICRTRCFYVYKYITEYAKRKNINVVCLLDMGFFPGTLVKVLKNLMKDNVRCSGAGLKVDTDFEKHMKQYVERCEYTEFDPFYAKGEQLRSTYFEDRSFDVVVATEIFEHLISPLEFIAEGSRVLRKGGIFIITTPNVSHIGAVIKLMAGKSNYERLDRSPMNLQNDEWRGHIRFYDKQELQELFRRHNLKLVHHRYFTEYGWDHVKRSFAQNLVYWIKKVIWIFPIYREGHFAVFEKI